MSVSKEDLSWPNVDLACVRDALISGSLVTPVESAASYRLANTIRIQVGIPRPGISHSRSQQ
jgi:hypothetical protein